MLFLAREYLPFPRPIAARRATAAQVALNGTVRLNQKEDRHDEASSSRATQKEDRKQRAINKLGQIDRHASYVIRRRLLDFLIFN